MPIPRSLRSVARPTPRNVATGRFQDGRVEGALGGRTQADLRGRKGRLRPERVMKTAACLLIHSWMKQRATAPGPTYVPITGPTMLTGINRISRSSTCSRRSRSRSMAGSL